MSQGIHDVDERFELLGPLDESVGPARRISRQRSADLIQGALAAALPAAPAPTPPRKLPWKGVLVTSTCLAVMGAAAATSYGLWAPHAPKAGAPEVAAPVQVELPPAAPIAAEPVPEAAPSEEVVAEPPAPPVARTAPAPVAVEPEDLLRRANERRAAGQWREAEALYLRVIQSSPGTTSAYVAQVASGGLRLEHLGDAKGALRQYQQALRAKPRGMLSEEAQQGVAESWRALGDTQREARALEEFLTAHPDSLLAGSARRRLDELRALPQ
ncbi:tetratricopeptide repeat protein [Cystobacter fuscus]